MDADEFKDRTKAFGLRVVRLVEALPQSRTADVFGKPLLRCGTSVGANYRAACRAKSPADFIAQMKILVSTLFGGVYHCGVIMQQASGLAFASGRVVAG
jgi:hypothetical protein